MAGTSAASNVPQIQIRLVTKQKHYAVPDVPLSVHATISPAELMTLVNSILNATGTPSVEVLFDFLVYSEFLRSPLCYHIAKRNLSTEDVIQVEYFEKHPPPEPENCLIHDDWVATVAVTDKWILTGCYDHTLHIWTHYGKHKLTIPGHTAAVKSVAWISVDENIARFVSASRDQTAIVWQWDIMKNCVECIHVCRGHNQALESVSVSADESHMATGGWDNTIRIWTTSADDVNEPEVKKSKMDKGKTHLPKRALEGHKEAISDVLWVGNNEIISSSWDHTIRVWDVELGGIKNQLIGSKSFFDIDYSDTSGLLVTASADRHVRIYDPRSNEGSVIKATLTSHTQWVQAVSWSTSMSHMFLSGGYDNCLKLWDTRSPRVPMYDLTGHKDKIFSCTWKNPKLMVSGGADNTVRIFAYNQ